MQQRFSLPTSAEAAHELSQQAFLLQPVRQTLPQGGDTPNSPAGPQSENSKREEKSGNVAL